MTKTQINWVDPVAVNSLLTPSYEYLYRSAQGIRHPSAHLSCQVTLVGIVQHKLLGCLRSPSSPPLFALSRSVALVLPPSSAPPQLAPPLFLTLCYESLPPLCDAKRIPVIKVQEEERTARLRRNLRSYVRLCRGRYIPDLCLQGTAHRG